MANDYDESLGLAVKNALMPSGAFLLTFTDLTGLLEVEADALPLLPLEDRSSKCKSRAK